MSFFRKRRGSEWAPLYLVIVMAIAAVLIITLVKPMFRTASATAAENLQGAEVISKGAIFSLSLLLRRR